MQNISMNYLVHNEADIIEANIRYHASIGISQFVVMDNGSTDGTREIVQKLADEYPITILNSPNTGYQQSAWKTAMARESYRQGAKWSIANDADEFWLPKQGSITAHLHNKGASYQCKRYNMLITNECFIQEENTKNIWIDTPYMVKRPIALTSQDILYDNNISIMLHKIHAKVIVHNFGLVRIHGGNHRASHLGNLLYKKNLDSIVILHYPLRKKKIWMQTLQRRQQLLHNKSIKMGNHYRRWVHKMAEKEMLEKEISLLAPTKQHMQLLTEFGIVDTVPTLLPSFQSAYQHCTTLVKQTLQKSNI